MLYLIWSVLLCLICNMLGESPQGGAIIERSEIERLVAVLLLLDQRNKEQLHGAMMKMAKWSFPWAICLVSASEISPLCSSCDQLRGI